MTMTPSQAREKLDAHVQDDRVIANRVVGEVEEPLGTDAAGLPVAEIYQHDFIQSM